MRVLRLAAAASVLMALGAVPTEAKMIAGTAPDRRPDGAPVLSEYLKDAGWYARALLGVVEPYPASLRFLEDQGAWFTPFIHPGMGGPYDLRGWHAAKQPNQQ